MSRRITVLNGPNLNLLGQREPDIYGHETLADVEALCRATLPEGWEMTFAQSNAEHTLIDMVHAARQDTAGLVINAGAFTHTSVALRDAVAAFDGPVIEVHISNVHAREAFRHHSYLSDIANGVIIGCGTEGYRFAVMRLLSLIS